jgi:peptide/nickel transport system substrate-binding protein
MSRLAAAVVVVLGAVLISAPNHAAGQGAAALRVAMGTDANTFDPHNFRSGYDLLLDDLIYDTLVGIDADMKLYPRLASSWRQVDDRTWVFSLRRGVKFHDGTDFNAEAVRVNFERASKALKAQTYYNVIERVTALDDFTVQFRLQRAFAPFLTNLAIPVGGVISPTALQRYGDGIVRNPVGTGPYRLREWVPSDRVVLTQNETYWGPKPSLQQVVFRPIPEEGTRFLAIAGAEVDAIINPPAHLIRSLRSHPDYHVLVSPQARTLWLGFNFDDGVLKDRRVRQAVAAAVNRGALVEQVLEGLVREASTGVVPPEVLRTSPAVSQAFNPDSARRLLREAGYGGGLELRLWTPEGRYFGDRRVAEVVQEQLRAVGINAQMRVWEYGAYVGSLFRHEQQLWIIGWGFTAHPDAMFRAAFHSKGEANWTAYRNSQFDRLVDDAPAIIDQREMARAYRSIQRLLIQEDVAMVPIYHATNIYVVRRYVEDFRPHPLELLDLRTTRARR